MVIYSDRVVLVLVYGVEVTWVLTLISLWLLSGLIRVILWQIELLLVLTRRVFSGRDASLDWPKAFQLSACPVQSWATVAYAFALLLANLGFTWMTGKWMRAFAVWCSC